MPERRASDAIDPRPPFASATLNVEAETKIYGRIEILSEQILAGWAFKRDKSPIYVTCSFDGVVIGGTIANSARSDVASAGSFAPANCGFTFEFDLNNLLTRCKDFDELRQRLEVKVDELARLEFHCNDPFANFYRSSLADAQVRGHVDGLRDGMLSGWCVDNTTSEPATIHVLIDGMLQANLECSERRSDLQNLLSINYGGFNFVVPSRYRDGAPHKLRCLQPSERIELQGSPLIFELRAESNVLRSEILAFTEACARVEGELKTARRAFESYILKKPPFVEIYRYLWPTLETSEVTRARLSRLARESGGTALMTIILPTYKSDLKLLAAAIDSVQAQSDPNWELVVSDSATVPGPLKAMVEARATVDKRIKFVSSSRQLNISDNSNQALKAATGSIVGFLDHDDTLAPEAVFLMRQAFSTGDYDLIYSDEDKINPAGEHVDPHYKSAMNFDLLMSMNYMCHFLAVRREVLDRTKGFRGEFDGAQDWDLILQVVARIDRKRVGHIARVLYHWRMTELSTATSSTKKSYAVDHGIAAVNAYLKSAGHVAKAQKAHGLPYAEVIWGTPKCARLSIIVPTKDKLDLVMHCVSSLKTTLHGVSEYEILIVDNASAPRTAKAFEKMVADDLRIRLVNYCGPFNYSAINNYAVKSVRYENILFLNNDVFFLDNGWAAKMLGLVHSKNVGAVGLKLLYPDNTVQHCGVTIGNGGIAGHMFSNLDERDAGYFARALVDQEVSAVTAACLMMRKDVFEAVGGFETEGLSVAFNDVDLCLRIQELGYRNVLVASRYAFHAESKSRGPEDTPEKVLRFNKEIDFMKKRWGKKLQTDRCYNPNFDLMHTPFQRIAMNEVVQQELGLGIEAIVR